MIGLLGCKCTLLGQVELLVNQQPQVFLLRAQTTRIFYWKKGVKAGHNILCYLSTIAALASAVG